MPVYEYKCDCSENVIPFTMSIKDYQPTQSCESCGKEMSRFYTPVGAQFKGSGFYVTDNPK
jgi:putative FmdB family regulatory protein